MFCFFIILEKRAFFKSEIVRFRPAVKKQDRDRGPVLFVFNY